MWHNLLSALIGLSLLIVKGKASYRFLEAKNQTEEAIKESF